MREIIEQELVRLEEGLPEMAKQRDQLTQQILRIEGAIVTLRGLLAKEEPQVDIVAEEKSE